MSRVVSKGLFNYQLNGVLSEVAANSKQKEMNLLNANPGMMALKELAFSDDPAVDPAVKFMRFVASAKSFDQIFKEGIDECVHTEMKIPLRDGNDFEVPVLIHTPKHLVNKKSNPAWIYAHGGGVIAWNAEGCRGPLSFLALDNDVVCFNVDYRIAPETKFPKNALDFYCAVKHIVENAEDLGIDASRIAISGESGGGYICFATMVMLAQKDEGDLIKLAMPIVPMISDYCFSDMASMSNEERENALFRRKIWCCIANDLDTEKDNPLLFPAKASDEILAKMPPTIIWEFEFDHFITEATRMAHRMRKAGRLLEFRVQPGELHTSIYSDISSESFKMNTNDFSMAINEYFLS